MAKRILLVDDEEPVRSLIAAMIRDNRDYELLEARDGHEALQIAQKEAPDLVLLDIIMPGLDGFEVCRRLRADPRAKRTTIVMLTALVTQADRENARSAGADGYVAKPFSPLQLLKDVEQAFGI